MKIPQMIYYTDNRRWDSFQFLALVAKINILVHVAVHITTECDCWVTGLDIFKHGK